MIWFEKMIYCIHITIVAFNYFYNPLVKLYGVGTDLYAIMYVVSLNPVFPFEHLLTAESLNYTGSETTTINGLFNLFQ